MSIVLQIFFLVTVAVTAAPIKGITPRRLDDTTGATTVSGGSSDDQLKCGGCPCNMPCYRTSPPPPPPPPPKMPAPTTGLNCPPPPTAVAGSFLAPPAYIYITGPPGDLYPVNPYLSAASYRNFGVAQPAILVVTGLLGVTSFW